MNTVVVLQYKLRRLIGVPRDIFYTLIWSYIPEPPTAPPFSVMKRKHSTPFLDVTNAIYGVKRRRGTKDRSIAIFDGEGRILCGFCDLPGNFRLPMPGYLGYDICKDCELLYRE